MDGSPSPADPRPGPAPPESGPPPGPGTPPAAAPAVLREGEAEEALAAVSRRSWERDTSREVRWLLPVVGVVGGVGAVLLVALTVDAIAFGQRLRPGSIGFETFGGFIGTACQTIPGVLGIALTVVVIIVELSSTRYTPKVVDLFIGDPANFLMFLLYVTTSVYVFIVAYFVTPDFTPPFAGAVALGLAVLCIALLLPYFHYVIKFARPENIICRLSRRMAGWVRRATTGRVAIESAQQEVIKDIEGLSDISLGGIANADRWLVQASLWAMEGFLGEYLGMKGRLPREWFRVPEDHFLELPAERRRRITEQGIWIEFTCFRQFEVIFGRVLGNLPDVATTVALCLRSVCMQALRLGRSEVVGPGIKFFNTFIRRSLNARDLRACYNVLYQYRLLAEAMLETRPDLSVEIAGHLRYYGRLASDLGVAFILETAAHDLKDLNKAAFRAKSEVRESLLKIFLEVDWTPESAAQEVTLRGVRKAQALLASFYLQHGAEDLARRIHKDMQVEPLRRLKTIRDELLAVKDDEFWEITDRGVNFDYTDPQEKQELKRFFSWFEEPSATPAAVAPPAPDAAAAASAAAKAVPR